MELLNPNEIAKKFQVCRKTVLKKMRELGVINYGLTVRKPLFNLDEILEKLSQTQQLKQPQFERPKRRPVKQRYTERELEILREVWGL